MNLGCEHSSTVAAYIAEALDHPLPDEVAARARLHLLDTLAAIVSGSRLRAGRLAAAYVEAEGGRPEASVFGTPVVTTAANAALANAMAAHADETDDSHVGSRTHPGCGVVPAALAMAERGDRDGTALLRAVVLGYDIGTRFVMALGYSRPRAAMHSTHSLGSLFGAAAAAGALAGLDARQAEHLISYAVQQASGVPYWERDAEHVEKAFDFGGMGARNGVLAATMVAAGFSGVEGVLTGEHSYLSTFADHPHADVLTDGLGSRFEVMETAIKKWCVGSPIQAALDSLTALIDEHGLRADDVATITATMPDDRLHIVDDRDMPDVCLQHLIAVTLIDGTLGFAAAHDHARMEDRSVRAVRQRIRVAPSAELTQAKPPRQAIIEIETADGRHLRHHTRAVLGTPANPMSGAEVAAKARDLMEPVLGPDRTDRLVGAVLDIERFGPVKGLRPLLRT
jgi:2-methylcitrate dehydratase PrpD